MSEAKAPKARRFWFRITPHFEEDYVSWMVIWNGRVFGGFWPSFDFAYRRRIGGIGQ